jgi:hypothetical protein
MGLFLRDFFETEEGVDQSIHGNLELFGLSLCLSRDAEKHCREKKYMKIN